MTEEYDHLLPIADQQDIRRSQRERKTQKAMEVGAERWTGDESVVVRIDGMEHPREPLATYASGRYVLTRELGEGGMAVVYEAYETTDDLRKAFAIKIVKATFEEYLQRELVSLRILEQVRSPYLVKIYAVEPIFRCIRMQLLQGMDLHRRLENCGRIIAPLELVRIARQIAEALVAVHGAGIAHRDIKPANIFLARDHGRQRAVLLDFGIAIESETERTLREGSFGYAPPLEDFLRTDRPSRQRNDLYMLGKVLFKMLTGKLAGTDVINVVEYPTAYPRIRDFANKLYHDIREQRFCSAQQVADQLRCLGEETLPLQLPEILDRSLKIVSAIAVQVAAANVKEIGHGPVTVENIQLINEQASLLDSTDDDFLASCDEADDVLNLGRTLYELIVGDVPPPGMEDYAEFAREAKLCLPEPLLRTIRTMCASDANHRLGTVAEVQTRLYNVSKLLLESSEDKA